MSTESDLLERSKGIYESAMRDFEPYAVALMVSGGNDSITAAEVAKAIGAQIDFVIHCRTNTGIPETSQYVREVAGRYGRYVEQSAGDAYEKYVLRKGFIGRGYTAHTYAYHLLKAGPFRKAISKHIRQRTRNRTVLLLNGVRQDESDNRKYNMAETINFDPSQKKNVWVNIIHHWSKEDCTDFLNSCPINRNPVTQKLCRSGECMCGTMQEPAARVEASYYYPEWGKWLNDLESRVNERFPWRWGEDVPSWWAQEKAGQLRIPHPDFQPACQSCIAGGLE